MVSNAFQYELTRSQDLGLWGSLIYRGLARRSRRATFRRWILLGIQSTRVRVAMFRAGVFLNLTILLGYGQEYL